MPRTQVGANVARLRKARGWSAAELGTRMGYKTGGYINQIEWGMRGPGPEVLAKLAQAFGVEVNELTSPYDPDHH